MAPGAIIQDPPAMVGETLSHYRILEPLGAGGMGEVFVAEDLRLGRRVALKVLPARLAQDRKCRARLEREARALARLQHSAIVTLHEVEEDRGVLFLVMELVRGERLDRRIGRGELPLPELLEIATRVAEALAAAHELGVVHRDLKPANVVVGRDGVKVLDFGLALLCEPEPTAGDGADSETLTDSGTVVGTLPYMAPEQLRGRPADPRSDLFAFGVLLFEMATGRRPFQGGSSADLTSAILQRDPPSLRALRPDLPPDLERIVRHCLQKDPERRYQTAKDLRNELLELAESLRSATAGAEAATEGRPVAPPSPGRRWRSIGLGAGAAAVLIALAVFGLGLLSGPSEPVENPEARALLVRADHYESRGDTPGDLELAEQMLRAALAKEPGNPFLQGRLASLLARVQQYYPQSGRQEEIEELVEQALAADATVAPALAAKGRLALMRGDWAGAEAAARGISHRGPSDRERHALLAHALLGQGETEEAVREATRGLEEQDEPARRLTLARILFDTGGYNEAAVHYEKVLEMVPDSPNALSNLGTIYGMTGRNLDALHLFRKLARLKPQDDAAAANLGVVLFNLGNYDEAAAAFLRANEIKPLHPGHQHNVADAFAALGETEKAHAWLEQAVISYDRALAAGGPQPQLLAGRALALATMGRAEEARADIERALEQRPGDLMNLLQAARIEALLGDEQALYRRVEEAVKAGVPREQFNTDTTFAAYRERPQFAALIYDSRR